MKILGWMVFLSMMAEGVAFMDVEENPGVFLFPSFQQVDQFSPPSSPGGFWPEELRLEGVDSPDFSKASASSHSVLGSEAEDEPEPEPENGQAEVPKFFGGEGYRVIDSLLVEPYLEKKDEHTFTKLEEEVMDIFVNCGDNNRSRELLRMIQNIKEGTSWKAIWRAWTPSNAWACTLKHNVGYAYEKKSKQELLERIYEEILITKEMGQPSSASRRWEKENVVRFFIQETPEEKRERQKKNNLKHVRKSRANKKIRCEATYTEVMDWVITLPTAQQKEITLFVERDLSALHRGAPKEDVTSQEELTDPEMKEEKRRARERESAKRHRVAKVLREKFYDALNTCRNFKQAKKLIMMQERERLRTLYGYI